MLNPGTHHILPQEEHTHLIQNSSQNCFEHVQPLPITIARERVTHGKAHTHWVL